MRSVVSILLPFALLLAGACADKAAAPTAPTAVTAVTAVTEPPVAPTLTTPTSTIPSPGATVAGTITLPGGAGTFGARTINTNVIVQVVDTDLSAVVGAKGDFELRGVPAGDVTLRISGMGVDANVAVGTLQSNEAVHLAIVVSGTVPLISADSRLGHGQQTEIEGTIAETQAPNRIVVRNQLVEVAGSTVITRGNQVLKYADLAAGQRVHVRGTVSVTVSSTIVSADVIDVQSGGTTTPPPPAEVMVRGHVAGISGGSCDSRNLSFTVSAVGGGTKLVQASASTTFSSFSACASITPGIYVEAKGSIQTGSETLSASKIYVADEPTPITFTGTVATIISGTCGGRDVKFYAGVTGTSTVTKTVQTSAATTFSPACADVKVGARVTVEGQLQTGDLVVASKVTIVPAPPAPPTPSAPPASTPITFTGTVASIISGTCGGRDVKFYAGVTGTSTATKTVQTSAATTFSPACADVKVGAKVTVEGQLQAGDLVVASKVTIVPAPPTPPASTPITFTGTVASIISGSCGAANLYFYAGVTGTTSVTKFVQTSAGTAFSPSCTDIKVGAKVTVEGMLQEGGHVVAKKITIAAPAATTITISGTVSGFVATSCPALTFTVTTTGVTSTTTKVQTSSSTAFSPGCTPLKDGDKVKVEGTKPADTLLATTVTRY